MRTCSFSRQNGFSLLEALVALVIASLAFTALYATVGQSSKNVVDVQARVHAALIVRSVLASSTFVEDLARQPSGQWDGQWQWHVQVEPEQLNVDDAFAPSRGDSLRAARVTVNVLRDGVPVLAWSVWKAYKT